MPRIEATIVRPIEANNGNHPHVAPAATSSRSDSVGGDAYEAPGVSSTNSVAVPVSRRPALILEFNASKPVYHIDWFPATDATPNGPDGVNNMTGPGGACRTYDVAFGRNSEAEEGRVFRYPFSERGRTGWFGHCDKAAMVAATMFEPKRSVEYNGVVFEPRHIVALLEEVADTMCVATDFRGQRYNGPSDDPNDISPSAFLKTMQDWTAGGLDFPFIMDKDQGTQVWNQAYDQGKIYESEYPMVGMPRNMPFGAGMKFYQVELGATGVSDAARIYQAWVQRDSRGSVISQGWIVGAGQNTNPDFLWRALPAGDLSKIETWNRRPAANQHNKEIMPLDVGQLYIACLGFGAPRRS